MHSPWRQFIAPEATTIFPGKPASKGAPRARGNYKAPPSTRPILTTALLLTLSNVFMTFAWYAHLKKLGHKPRLLAALFSWGVAFFEYMFQVPGNRIGYSVLSAAQLEILQEVITLSVFVPCAIFHLKEPPKLEYLWASLCILGAVFFIFRSRWSGT